MRDLNVGPRGETDRGDRNPLSLEIVDVRTVPERNLAVEKLRKGVQ
jgi:hypothetical protein